MTLQCLLYTISSTFQFILLVSLTTGGPDGLNDIHARNLKTGKYLTLVEGESGIGNGTESTGLALTKDNKRMYVSFQGECVYEFWRLDGKAFDAVVVDTKYHTVSP